MPPRLTQAEKDARGTRQKCRDVAPRPLAQVRREIRDTRAAVKALQFNLRQASEAIKTEGVIIDNTVLDSSGAAHTQKKIHPALKVQKEALAGLKDLKRSLVLLREEEQLASVAKQDAGEYADFD